MVHTRSRTSPDGRSLATALGFVVLVNAVGANETLPERDVSAERGGDTDSHGLPLGILIG
ncbi:hypothetical protein [Haloprofundus halobius]|uniref:hypothetical protein n=1 Tax=Haloprofundus halobius TaxID=2876194 RepID=UPI001CCFB301|nr:hypothetical protein [Haloprofundus halobius]